MNTLPEKKQSRREFLRGSMRYLTLGGLVFMTGALFARRKASSAEEKCINPSLRSRAGLSLRSKAVLGICRGCSVFKNCGLPPALSARKTMAR